MQNRSGLGLPVTQAVVRSDAGALTTSAVARATAAAIDTRASPVNPPDEYTALRAEFALWLISSEKVPVLQREWAEQHGIAEETASRWRQHPEVLAIVTDWRERLRGELGRVMANMVRLASTGDGMPAVQAARLLLETYGEMSPTRVDHTVTLASYVSGRLGPGGTR